jgi:N-acetylmuramic acid 6-phosphate etherase
MQIENFSITESAKLKAKNFIENETQFQLGFLPTEQSNPITATLEDDFKRSTIAGIQCLQRGDRQMPITMRHVFASDKFTKLVDAIVDSVTGVKGRVIFSGCGATGRLSILLESMWRDFFYRRANELTPEELALADRSASIMTGGDFALIRSVEFFEDYAEGGRRQAKALQVGEGDTFVAITEGGETSSVLGTLKYAAEQGAKCFLVFNNPAYLLRNHLDRCREAIDNKAVTVIDLYCGSMSVAGSTRMQATSSEQLLCSCALEAALCRVLPRFASETAKDYTIAFEALLSGLESDAGRLAIAKQIELEKGVYESGGRITYVADKCMLDLFTDNTERAPTFMIPPLRSSREKSFSQSWAFVKNPLHPTEQCWHEMMRRTPRCLEFTSEDARSLNMPQSFIDNPPLIKYSDLITYMIGNEPSPERIEGYERAVAVILRVPGESSDFVEAADRLASAWPEKAEFSFPFPIADSPLEIWKHLAVKLAFNCLSTGTMATIGRISGNWMSWVSMSNKKLIDRCIRLLVELGKVDYKTATETVFAAQEWIAAQDWSSCEEPSPVQVALAAIKARSN